MYRKASRGGLMAAAKRRAAKHPGGKGPVRSRAAGKRIMGRTPKRKPKLFDWL